GAAPAGARRRLSRFSAAPAQRTRAHPPFRCASRGLRREEAGGAARARAGSRRACGLGLRHRPHRHRLRPLLPRFSLRQQGLADRPSRPRALARGFLRAALGARNRAHRGTRDERPLTRPDRRHLQISTQLRTDREPSLRPTSKKTISVVRRMFAVSERGPPIRREHEHASVMNLAPVVTPHGVLTLAPSGEEAALPPERVARLQQAFARGSGHGLLHLGVDEVGTALPAVLSYWRWVGARC